MKNPGSYTSLPNTLSGLDKLFGARKAWWNLEMKMYHKDALNSIIKEVEVNDPNAHWKSLIDHFLFFLLYYNLKEQTEMFHYWTFMLRLSRAALAQSQWLLQKVPIEACTMHKVILLSLHSEFCKPLQTFLQNFWKLLFLIVYNTSLGMPICIPIPNDFFLLYSI